MLQWNHSWEYFSFLIKRFLCFFLLFTVGFHSGSIFLFHPQPGKTQNLRNERKIKILAAKSKYEEREQDIRKNYHYHQYHLDTPPWINLKKSGSSRQPLKSHHGKSSVTNLLDKLLFIKASIPVDIESFEDLLGLFKGRLPRLAL